MKTPNYFVIELNKEFNAAHNSQVYEKGVRVLVWEDTEINCYWTTNTNDIISCDSAKKIYSLDLKVIKDEHTVEPQQDKFSFNGLGFLLKLLDKFCEKCGTNDAGDCDSLCPNYEICNKEQWDKVRSEFNIIINGTAIKYMKANPYKNVLTRITDGLNYTYDMDGILRVYKEKWEVSDQKFSKNEYWIFPK